jgi:hypothetical protein
MRHLSGLLTAHAFPSALARIRASFARQPDRQTCGASAIRHGLLLGGLIIPTSALEAVLAIRANQGTSPGNLLGCLHRLGLDAQLIHKRRRQSTGAFLRRLRDEFQRGAFLLPCIHGAEHWVCLGAWHDGRVAVVDSFFDHWLPSLEAGARSPELGFFTLSPEELDAIDWAHFVTLVRPGIWQAQYQAWLPARAALLRIDVHPAIVGRGGRDEGDGKQRETASKKGAPLTLVQALRQGAHQYLDDADYSYQRLHLQLPGGPSVSMTSADPGADAVGVETVGHGREEVVVVRRLGGVLTGTTPPELVVRSAGLGAGYLAGERGEAPE